MRQTDTALRCRFSKVRNRETFDLEGLYAVKLSKLLDLVVGLYREGLTEKEGAIKRNLLTKCFRSPQYLKRVEAT